MRRACTTPSTPDRTPTAAAGGRTRFQLVMHATSRDGMATWQRHPADTSVRPPATRRRMARPVRVRDAEAGIWRMLITARHATADRRRGVIAQCTSTDLRTWTPAAPFWDPRRYVAHECPEVFEWNGWWYLVYSEFSESFTTRYRMSRSLHGPWIVPRTTPWTVVRITPRSPPPVTAAVSSSGGSPPARAASTTARGSGPARFRAGGRAARRRDAALPPPARVRRHVRRARTGLAAGTILRALDGYADALVPVEAPRAFRVRARFDIAPHTTECGILLRASADGDEGYVLRLEPRRGRWCSTAGRACAPARTVADLRRRAHAVELERRPASIRGSTPSR